MKVFKLFFLQKIKHTQTPDNIPDIRCHRLTVKLAAMFQELRLTINCFLHFIIYLLSP